MSATTARLSICVGSVWGQVCVTMARKLKLTPDDVQVQEVASGESLITDSAGQTAAQGGLAVVSWLLERGGFPALDDASVAFMERGDRELVDAAAVAGLADDASQYAAPYGQVFAYLDDVDQLLRQRRWVQGGANPTVADLWLAVALLHFDLAFYGLYKCNRTRLQDFVSLPGYVRDVMQHDGNDNAHHPRAIRSAYYQAEVRINPKLRVPKSDGFDPWLPHDRAERFGQGDLRAAGVEEAAGASRRPGEWVRPQSRHRDQITADGSSGFAAKAGRYHLYVANNCPWCHRVALARELKGLTDVVSMDVLYWRRDPDRGWQFKPDAEGCTPDTIFGNRYIKQLYERLGSPEKSVPVLYDRVTDTIVNNESSEIIRIFDSAFAGLVPPTVTLCPEPLRAEIDRINAWVFREINNGVYKAGFASAQSAYERAHDRVFSALAELDRRLADRTFLLGDAMTEADVRLFPTIFRFDPIYYTRFCLDAAMVRDHRHLQRWHDAMLANEAIARASNLQHAKNGYFGRTGNNIVPLGPDFGH